MKKIYVLLFLFILTINTVFAGTDKNYTINFNGEKFYLLYSVKNKDFGGYLNEYYKKGETYNIWTELAAVHHFPNAYSPIDRIKDFKDYLGSMQVPSALTFDDKNNTAMIDFILISDHSMPIVIEFNIFKYEKSKKCGSIAMQYARRYTATTTMQIEAIKKDIEKNRSKLISKVKNFDIPEVITKDIDKCISASDVINSDKTETAITTTEITIAEEKETNTDVTKKSDIEKQTLEAEPTTNNTIKQEDAKIDSDRTQEIQTKSQIAENIENKTNNIININSENTSNDKDKQEHLLSNNNIDVTTANDNILKEKETENKKGIEPKTENEQKIIAAPIPANNTEEIQINKSKSKRKNINYEIKNDKNELIAKPRTKSELKAEIMNKKLKQRNARKQAKVQAKIDKKAEKHSYTLTNNNSDLIAKPRTKNELREEIKRNKEIKKNERILAQKKAKEDAINAKIQKKEEQKLEKLKIKEDKKEEKERLKEEKKLARGEKIQNRIDKNELKKQEKFDKRQNKYNQKELKQIEKENTKIKKKNDKIKKQEEKENKKIKKKNDKIKKQEEKKKIIKEKQDKVKSVKKSKK